PVYDPSTRTLTVAQLPYDVDADPLTIYASALDASVIAFDTDTSAFFGSGTRAVPAAVAAGHLTGSVAPPGPGGAAGRAMFALRSPVSLAPGASVTLRYTYGFGHPSQVQTLLARYRSQPDPLGASERQCSAWLPKTSLGSSYAWLARELVWDAYLVRSGATYEAICGWHLLSQGGYYQYAFGFQGAFRDPLQLLLPMIWSILYLAREVVSCSAHAVTRAVHA